jgi:para-nitrobenzyl esterase
MRAARVWGIAVLLVLLVPASLTVAVFVSARRAPPPLVLGPVVQTEVGAIQGAVVDDIAVYRGVPFAEPPVGQLRWRSPQPAKPWSGVLKTTEFKPACMQVPSKVTGLAAGAISEDCLYLNIWAPASPPKTKLPVMVYLHGGAGMNGSASLRIYWGDALVRRGVITVNVSYRLGSLGWLAHPDLTREADYHASGNYAVLDMIAALRWVRDNIAAFGGDPGNVTVFGQSAGAFNASRLMASPLAEGLFHKVIGQSGGDFYPSGTRGGTARLAEAERAGVEFMRVLGAFSVDELRDIPADRIIATPWPESQTRLPIIDGYVTVADNQERYRKGSQQKVPILVGYNELEGAALGDPLEAAPPASAAEFVMRVRESYGELAPRILDVYPANTDEQAQQSFVRLRGEEAINWNVVTWASLHGATGQSDVYLYYFAKRPPFGPLRKFGAAHGAELPYVFGFVPKWMRLFTQWPWKAHQDLALTEQIPSYWTNFAKTGNPNGAGLPDWPTYNESRRLMHFGDGATALGGLPHEDQHQLMDRFVERLACAEGTAARECRRVDQSADALSRAAASDRFGSLESPPRALRVAEL